MKKKMVLMVIFVLAFIVTYTLLCFVYPGGKMALEATPFDYIRLALTHMALFKILVSLVVALVVGAIPMIVERKKR